jgi:hypothetical protein
MMPAIAFIDAILEADRKAPRKQRHTAHRIWQRIREEVPDCTAAAISCDACCGVFMRSAQSRRVCVCSA